MKDFLIGVFIAAEFTVTNFGQVMEAVWARLLAKSLEYFNTVAHFFTSTLPSLISGGAVIERQVGMLESLARQSADRLTAGVQGSYQAFFTRRMNEINSFHFPHGPHVEQEAAHAGEQVGGAFFGAIKKEKDKFDVALFGSAEALFRVKHYMEVNSIQPTTQPAFQPATGGRTGARAGVPMGDPNNPLIIQPARGQMDPHQPRIVELLTGCRDALNALAGRPPITLSTAE